LHIVEKATDSLKNGKFILVHDDKNREDEVDMVIPAQYITPQHISKMRNDAGGLICLAISNEIAESLGITYMHDLLRYHPDSIFLKLTEGYSKYGDKPSFSISINHRETYTGITDFDRSLTISKMSEICNEINNNGKINFKENFMTPGHVNLLISSKNLLSDRIGHTELSIQLASIAKLTPAMVICEMLDSISYRALTLEQAKKYAEKNSLVIVDSSEVLKYLNYKK